jgi:hypothetical protein
MNDPAHQTDDPDEHLAYAPKWARNPAYRHRLVRKVYDQDLAHETADLTENNRTEDTIGAILARADSLHPEADLAVQHSRLLHSLDPHILPDARSASRRAQFVFGLFAGIVLAAAAAGVANGHPCRCEVGIVRQALATAGADQRGVGHALAPSRAPFHRRAGTFG